MTGDSSGVAGIDTLSIGQLEDRLQLAMAVRQHLTDQGVVSRNDMRVAMESLGVELPAHAPLNSFTEQPSRTNYAVAVSFIQTEEQTLINKVRDSARRELTQTLEEIGTLIYKSDAEPYEPRYAMLKIVSKYLTGYTLPTDCADEIMQTELNKVSEVMTEWQKRKQLGQDVLSNAQLYRTALELWQSVARVVDEKFMISNSDDETAILQVLNNFFATARAASHIEPETLWSPEEVVAHTLEFMQSFNGAIPYKFQGDSDGLQRLLREVDSIEDQRTLHSLRVMADAVRTYLTWCWRLEDARVSAVDTSIAICRAAGHLRSMTA